MIVECANCGATLRRPPHRINRAGTKGALAGLHFCNRTCQKQNFRVEHTCCWPGCEAKILVTKQRHRLKKHSSFFCEAHMRWLRDRLGAATTATQARRDFLSDKHIGHRRVTGKFVRLVVLELSSGACAECRTKLDPDRFFVDHKVPVFEGGESKLSNLQPLCRPCHRRKTAKEQARVNASRWSKDRPGANRRAMTHVEKDHLIARLLDEIGALKARLGECADEHDPQHDDGFGK